MTAVTILCFLVICVKSCRQSLELSSASELLALYSLQNPEYFLEVAAFEKPANDCTILVSLFIHISLIPGYHGDRAVYVLERACVAGAMTC